MLKARPGIVPFAIAITLLNLLGHAVLGFEQAWAHPFVALAAAYAAELATELCIRGWRQARFRGGPRTLVVFLLPAHITGLAVAMLLYANEQFLVLAFAAAAAIFSKVLFRVDAPGSPQGSVHFLNPSNFGISLTLLVFSSWMGVAAPYQFTEETGALLDWLLPAAIVCSGSLLNIRATRRIGVALGWLGGFAAQAALRSAAEAGSLASLLAPMTGMAFVLFTFYMVPDPATTPAGLKAQLGFGAAVALVYGALAHFGIVFGMFFALTIVCAGRGALLQWRAWRLRPASSILGRQPGAGA
jgi:hypothetical protein